MIAEVLNRDFVLRQLAMVQRHLQSGGRRSGSGMPPPGNVTTEDLAVAAAEIDKSLSAEVTSPSGPTGFDVPPSDRRGETAEPIEARAFFSSDPVISLTQSVLERYFNDSANTIGVDETSSRRGGDPEDPVTDRSLRGKSAGRRIFDEFSVTDPEWVSSLIAIGIQKFRNPHQFNASPAPPVAIGDRCRILMVGDWGSGIPRARNTAIAMRSYIDECLKQDINCHVIHLGDVYYSGWDFEYIERFLPYWPVRKGEQGKVGSWCLNGNHDMYSGGYGYYDTLLADPRFAPQNKSSFFRLYNRHWQILGLDTAYEDNGLKDPQSKWVKDTLAANTQKTMILTHHQLFSAYENSNGVGAVLRQKLEPLFSAGRIDAAIWGHEHRCVIHSAHENIKYGRLVGHGGVPVYMPHSEGDPYPAPAVFEDRRFIPYGLELWAYMGFAVMDFDGPSLSTRYVDENGYVTREETY